MRSFSTYETYTNQASTFTAANYDPETAELSRPPVPATPSSRPSTTMVSRSGTPPKAGSMRKIFRPPVAT